MTTDTLIFGTQNDAISLAHKAHRGQTYGDGDYTRHLRDVAMYLGSNGFVDDEWGIAAWLHDTVEDTEVTIEQIEEQFGPRVAKLVAAVTTPLSIGNRKARLDALIQQLQGCPEALPLKLADRIANVQHSWFHQDTKLFMYYREYPRFRKALRGISDDPQVMVMWGILDNLLGWWEPPKEKQHVDP